MNIESSVADRIPSRKKIGSCAGSQIDPFRKREIYYESQLERDHMARFIVRPDVVEIREQQLVEYVKNGKDCKHYVDFIVELDTGHRIAYFVKNSVDAEKKKLRESIHEIVAGCDESFADEYIILTEHHLDHVAVANSKFIIQCGKEFDYDATSAVRTCLRSLGSTVTPRQIEELTGLGDRGSRALVALLQSGDVRLAVPGAQIETETPFENSITGS
ncbi:hypothetical protein V1281_001969 [Nitrobacteraceae bacterium AZCC 2161]